MIPMLALEGAAAPPSLVLAPIHQYVCAAIALALIVLGVIGTCGARHSRFAATVYAVIAVLGGALLIRALTTTHGSPGTPDLLGLVVLAVVLLLLKRTGALQAIGRYMLSGVLALGGVIGVWFALAGTPVYVQVLVISVVVAGGLTFIVSRARSSSVVTRWGARTRRTAGVATTVDLIRVASALAMRRTAAVVRPNLRGARRWEIARLPITEVAVRLCRTAGLSVYASLEDVVTIFGGPRVGKTGWLLGAIIDHPGAVLATSTRVELILHTRAHRECRGPVYIWNPGGLGDLPSTITFDPLSGCIDPTVATERAADMIPEAEGSGDRAYWQGQARRVLAALMHAAALGGLGMPDVLRWVADPQAAQRQVTSLLRKSRVPAYVQDATQFVTTNDKTRSSITSSIMPALSWLTSPTAVAAATGDGPTFDVEELLRERGTIYLLGRHESHTAPLLAAFTGYVAREARRLAAKQPGGRLDPPPGLFLDEAARVVPVPLPDWTGDFGGSGIFICPAFQSRADIIDRYGPTGAAKILNNSGAAMLFGGTKDVADLEQWSKLAGERDEVVKTYGDEGKVTSRTVRKAPVLSVAQLSNLPKGKAVVFRRGMPPAIGRVLMVWERRDLRRASQAPSPAVTASPTPSPTGRESVSPTTSPTPSPTPAARETVAAATR